MNVLPCSRHFVFRKFMCAVLIELFVSRSILHFSRLHFDTGFEWFGHGHRVERYFLLYKLSLCSRDFNLFKGSQVWLWNLVPIQSFINIVNFYWWKSSSQMTGPDVGGVGGDGGDVGEATKVSPGRPFSSSQVKLEPWRHLFSRWGGYQAPASFCTTEGRPREALALGPNSRIAIT